CGGRGDVAAWWKRGSVAARSRTKRTHRWTGLTFETVVAGMQGAQLTARGARQLRGLFGVRRAGMWGRKGRGDCAGWSRDGSVAVRSRKRENVPARSAHQVRDVRGCGGAGTQLRGGMVGQWRQRREREHVPACGGHKRAAWGASTAWAFRRAACGHAGMQGRWWRCRVVESSGGGGQATNANACGWGAKGWAGRGGGEGLLSGDATENARFLLPNRVIEFAT
ncbi:hypothetical protein EI94DRAFT_1878302, partial [Lactarius quietus]